MMKKLFWFCIILGSLTFSKEVNGYTRYIENKDIDILKEVKNPKEYLEEKYSTTPFEVINITDGYFSYDKKLPDTLQKYHFVLTESCRPEFKDAYSDTRFTITEIKQKDYK